MENMHIDVRVLRVNSAPEIVKSTGEKERKFLKHSTSKPNFVVNGMEILMIYGNHLLEFPLS